MSSVCSKVSAEVIVIVLFALTLAIWHCKGETVQPDKSILVQSAFWKVKGFVTLKKNSTGVSSIVKSSHIAKVMVPVNRPLEHKTLQSNTQILATALEIVAPVKSPIPGVTVLDLHRWGDALNFHYH